MTYLAVLLSHKAGSILAILARPRGTLVWGFGDVGEGRIRAIIAVTRLEFVMFKAVRETVDYFNISTSRGITQLVLVAVLTLLSFGPRLQQRWRTTSKFLSRTERRTEPTMST